MSSDENLSQNSSSSSDTSNFIEIDEWESRVVQQNHEIDRIIEDVIISTPTLILQPTNIATKPRRRVIERHREENEDRLFNDYFSDSPTYPPNIFRRRFRMRKHVFLRIVKEITNNNEYFQQRINAAGRKGLSPLQKCTAAIRVLAYGTSSDAVDEYMRMSEIVTSDSLIRFVEGVILNFGSQYLRRPNEEDLARLLYVGEQRGFPAWAGQFAGRNGKPTLILEAVATYDLWIWHAFFGTLRSINDINVLHKSPIFSDILEGRAPKISYVVNNRESNIGYYYLTDGIYPSWATFVKSITYPTVEKQKTFALHQEATRKDVKRAFGVLQSRFAFIKRPCLIWDRHFIGRVMMPCIIMHNMIVEDEQDTYRNYYDPTEFINDELTNRKRIKRNGVEQAINLPIKELVEEDDNQHFQYSNQRIASLTTYITNREQLHNKEAHIALKNDLIEHI